MAVVTDNMSGPHPSIWDFFPLYHFCFWMFPICIQIFLNEWNNCYGTEYNVTSRRRVQWALNQPEDDSAHSSGDMLTPGESWSQGGSQKRLKSEATWERDLERKDTQTLWRAYTLKSFNIFPVRSPSKTKQELHFALVDFWDGLDIVKYSSQQSPGI